MSWAGFNVLGWARTPHTIAGVQRCSGSDALDALLLQVDVLVSVLPSNAGTRGLLGNGRLRRQSALQMPSVETVAPPSATIACRSSRGRAVPRGRK